MSASEPVAVPPGPVLPPVPASPRFLARSTWERIALHPDLELHVRRPLAHADQRRLDELLEQAKRIFGAER